MGEVDDDVDVGGLLEQGERLVDALGVDQNHRRIATVEVDTAARGCQCSAKIGGLGEFIGAEIVRIDSVADH